jgi:YHS domain-containing protein
MIRNLFLPALTGALMLAAAGAASAGTGEFDNLCAEGLALGQEVKTDCSINETIDGKTYCFGNETAKMLFMANPEANLAKAQEYYSSKKQ